MDREGFPPRTRICDEEDSFSSYKREELATHRAEERKQQQQGKARKHHPIYASEEESDEDSYSRYKRWEATAARIAERKRKAEEEKPKVQRSWSPRHSREKSRSTDLRKDIGTSMFKDPWKQDSREHKKRNGMSGLKHTAEILHALPSPSIKPVRMKLENRWSTEESVSELLSGLKHRRVKADEMIDLKSGVKFHPFLAKDIEKNPVPTSPVQEIISSESSSKSSPRHWHAKPLRSNPKTPPGRPALLVRCSSDRIEAASPNAKRKELTAAEIEALFSAVEEEEVALASPPLISPNSPYKPLPPIPEVSPLKEEELLRAASTNANPKPARISSPLGSPLSHSRTPSSPLSSPTTSRRRSRTSPLYSAVISDPTWHSTPSTPVYLHGPIRLPTRPTDPPSPEERRSSVGTIDWTTFQNAISGPTGTYLMGGESPVVESATEEIVEWFEEFGFQSEGRVITAEEELGPIELPAAEVAQADFESEVIDEGVEVQTPPAEEEEDIERGPMVGNLEELQTLPIDTGVANDGKELGSWLRLSRESSIEEIERPRSNLSNLSDYLAHESKGMGPFTPSP
ncbi:MAG: hypothetical protein M1812_006237 [Candelaria pacifica]|nr:MAG: hypothetical protein M1812_006237 [Candelaria pacifica]